MRNGGEGPGRQTETHRGDRVSGATVRGALRTAGRVALWAFLALVLARGIGDILADSGPAPAPESRADLREAFPGTEAEAFAVSFARAYLTWDPAQPEALQRRLAEYAAPDLVERLLPELPTDGDPQTVVGTAIARSERLGADRGLVTIACALGGRDQVRYLAVSVARGPDGELAIDAPPALVAAPALAEVAGPEDVELSDAAAAEIESLAGDFLDAYLTGGDARELRRLLAPGVRVVPARVEAVSVRVMGVFDAGVRSPSRRAVAVDVRVRISEDGATLPLRYRLELARTDRWYVRSIAGGAS